MAQRRCQVHLVLMSIAPSDSKRESVISNFHYFHGPSFEYKMVVTSEPFGTFANSGMHRDLYLWAATIFSSRGFGSTVALPNTQEKFAILYPGVDFLNHASAGRVTWAFDDGSFTITNNQDIAAGQQVVNNYGGKGNEECKCHTTDAQGKKFEVNCSKCLWATASVSLTTRAMK
jgi:hypothetical protein